MKKKAKSNHFFFFVHFHTIHNFFHQTDQRWWISVFVVRLKGNLLSNLNSSTKNVKPLYVHKKCKTVCGVVSSKRKTLLLLFVENDRDDKIKASGVITLLQFIIWVLNSNYTQNPSAFPSSGNEKARIARCLLHLKNLQLEMTHWTTFTCRI